jgi:hypothetical protein
MKGSNSFVHTCPIANCNKKFKSRRELRDHLIAKHLATELKTISRQKFISYDLHPCKHCCKKIFLIQSSLENHQTDFCSATKDESTDDGTNTTKACNTFAIAKPSNALWEESLQWFTADDMVTTPVPIRRAMFDKLNPGTKKQFFDLYEQLMTLAATSPLKLPTNEGTEWQNTATPFILMSFLLPAMILAPLEAGHKGSISSRIHSRIIRFKEGEAKALLQEVHATKCWTPLEKRQRAEMTGANITKAAQSAADSGHLGGCMKQILNAFPPVLFTPDCLKTMQGLFPSELLGGGMTTRRNHTPPTTDKAEHNFDYTKGELLRYLSHVKKGKGAGPFADPTDCIRDMGTFLHGKSSESPYIDAVARYLQIFMSPDLNEKVREMFAGVYAIAFHKDWPNNPNKIRPANIGTAPRRILAGIIARHNKHRFCDHLLPFNFIAVRGGAQAVYHTLHLECHRHVFRTREQLMAGFLPDKVLLSLDLVNMFNNMSRRQCRNLLRQYFPDLLSVFDNMYKKATKVWTTLPDGSPHALLMIEGFSQGCPLSSLFAALILHEILTDIKREHDSRRSGTKRKAGTGEVEIMPIAFMDDTNILLPINDVAWFLKRMRTLGAPVGVIVGKDKTKILTNITGTSILPFLPPKQADELKSALDEYTGGECTTGLRILGSPLGSNPFQKEYTNTFTHTMINDTAKMCKQLPDTQTVTQIYKECLVARVPFQLTADILTNIDPNNLPENNQDWQSPLTDAIRQTTRDIIGHATALDKIPEYALEIACIPESLHGLGITSPDRIAVLSFLLPLFRTIRYATKGVPLPHRTVKLGSYFADLYSGWETSTDPLFVIMRHYAEPIAESMTIPAKYSGLSPLQYLVGVHELGSFQHKRTKIAFDHRKKSLIRDPEPFLGCTNTSEWTSHINGPSIAADEDIIFDTTPDIPVEMWDWTTALTTTAIRQGLHGLFHSSIEAHFLTATRSEPTHRLSPHLFRIALARRLRLPVHTYRRKCKCDKGWLDIFGDHYFDCHRHFPKTGLHNRVRDGFYHILGDIAMHTPHMHGAQDVLHEPTNVAPDYPTVRPGDVVLRLHEHKHLQACAIDFSMVATPKGADNAHKQRTNQIRMHTVRELEKWKGMSSPRVKPKPDNDPTKTTTTTTPQTDPTSTTDDPDENDLDPGLRRHHVIQNLHNNGISMVPATIGSFGDFGPMLEMLLYGTFPSDVNYMTQLAKHRVGVAHTKQVCLHARSRAKVKSLLPSADQGWRQHFGRRWFGSTYQDMSPQPSARKNIGLMIARQMAQHISIGATRAATKFISHDPPTRTRPPKSRCATGGLPLSNDRDCYGIPMDPDTPTEILNFADSALEQAPNVDNMEGEFV